MNDRATEGASQDVLSPRATTILRATGDAAYRRLIVKGPTPNAARAALEGVTPDQLFIAPIRHPDDANAALAGLWLWLDALHESHEIAQAIVSPTGSLWHAILHRREGDFSNAKYWYERAGNHGSLKMLGAVTSSIAGALASDPAVSRVVAESYDPCAFVDLVEAVHAQPQNPRHDFAVRMQIAEWQALFNHCVNLAVEDDQSNLDAWDRRSIHPPSAGGN